MFSPVPGFTEPVLNDMGPNETCISVKISKRHHGVLTLENENNSKTTPNLQHEKGKKELP